MSHGSPCIGSSQGFREQSTRWWKDLHRSLLSVSEQVISPCSMLPRACCTWLSHRHIPGERADKPGQRTQTVIHLFSSRRCSCPFFLLVLSQRYWTVWRSKSNVNAGQGKKINDKWLRAGNFMWSSYWPIFPSIIQSRLQSKKYNKEIHWVMTILGTSHYKGAFFYWSKHYDVIGLETACSGLTVDSNAKGGRNNRNTS